MKFRELIVRFFRISGEIHKVSHSGIKRITEKIHEGIFWEISDNIRGGFLIIIIYKLVKSFTLKRSNWVRFYSKLSTICIKALLDGSQYKTSQCDMKHVKMKHESAQNWVFSENYKQINTSPILFSFLRELEEI